jgi:hypothetical protein
MMPHEDIKLLLATLWYRKNTKQLPKVFLHTTTSKNSFLQTTNTHLQQDIPTTHTTKTYLQRKRSRQTCTANTFPSIYKEPNVSPIIPSSSTSSRLPAFVGFANEHTLAPSPALLQIARRTPYNLLNHPTHLQRNTKYQIQQLTQWSLETKSPTCRPNGPPRSVTACTS